MKEVSLKLKLKTSKASPNAISLQESAAGPSPCNSQESATKQDSGQEARRASRSALPENSSGSLTHGTSRQFSSASLASAALQSSLGNRLRQQLQNRGCAIYRLTWKEKITPSGLPYSQLVASVHRTNGTDFSLVRSNWPTPAATEFECDPMKVLARREKCRTERNNGNGFGLTLGQCVPIYLTGWPTRGHKDGVVSLMQPIRIMGSGQMLTGSDAGMESFGQLNPAHSRWLMGFPPEWDDCAVTAMQSYRKSLPNSSLLSWVPLAKRLRTKK